MTSSISVKELKIIIENIAYNEDQHAFKQFFNYFYPKMLKLALYYLESTQASEEIVSTVFIGIWNNRNKLPDIKKLEAYLFSSVKNKSFSYLRDNKRIHHGDYESEESMLIPSMNNPAADLLNKELKEKIFTAIDTLPPRCKMIFILIRIDGLKYKEVSELLDISPKTVEVHLGRALIKLREKLLPYVDDIDLKHYMGSNHNFISALLSIFL